MTEIIGKKNQMDKIVKIKKKFLAQEMIVSNCAQLQPF